jgi:hypothetical protein
VRGTLVPPGPDHGLYDVGRPPITTYTTQSGLQVHVPVQGNRCWDAPLPCTPHPAPNLRLRSTDLGDGFAVDGDWQALRFPSPESGFLGWWRAQVRR